MKNRNRILAVLLAGFMSVTTAFGSSTVAFATDYAEDAVELDASEESPEEAEVVAPEETEEASEETEETTEDIVVEDEVAEETTDFEEDEVTITTIADVLKAATGEFTVKGVVNFVNGKNVYVQDDTAAICAYLKAVDKDLKAGDLITVKGKFKDYNGLAELESAEIVNKDATNTKTYEATVIDETNIADFVANHDKYESQKVVTSGAKIASVENLSAGKVDISIGDKTVLVYDKVNAATMFADMAAGDAVNVTAIVGDFKGVQLLPISAEKITGVTAEVVVAPEAGEIKAGQELAMTCATSGAKIFYSINGAEEATYDETKKPVIAAADFVKAAETDEVAKATVVVYSKADGQDASEKKTLVYTQAKVKEVKSSPKAGTVKKGTAITLATATEGAKISYSLDNGKTYVDYKDPFKLETLPATVMAKASCEGYLDSEVATFEFTERDNKEYNIYFGQLHSHTSYSDGAGTCEEAFNHAANEVENLDFLAVTDHSNSFDNDTSANIKDGSASSEWVEGHELADKYTSSDFVALYGYEMTWSGGAPGHMNTFNTDGFMSRNMAGYESKSRTALQNYYADLVNTPDSISMFNHPGTTFGDFYDFAYYSKENDKQITLIEVGNGEGAIGSAGYFPSYEYYTRALDKGWHVAPANNQDNHKGRWGDANTGRSVILADSLTREDVYDAIHNMRVYATEDNDLNIYYTLNGEVMGTVLEEKPEAVKIKVKTSDATDSGMMNVEVVVNNGAVAASKSVEESAAEVEFDLAPDFNYYYIRVTQADGNIAVTAPVWISAVEALGVSTISTQTALPVAGEELTIDTAFFNNEETDFAVDSIVYTANGEVVHTTSVSGDLAAIKAHSEASDSFKFTADKAGKQTIVVTLLGKLNGVSKKYTATLELIFVDPDMVTHVVVDGTHLNDYVNGYYGGNVGNFADIAASDFVKVDVVTDTLTKEKLADAKVLVISAPNKNTKYGEVKHFEEDFINLVKEYVAEGGNLILCGLADYQDTKDGQSSTEINKLLEAIGATTRINSDEVIDNEKNGGQEYRLYPNNFNRDCYLVKGVTDTQVYSAYSGCSVLVDEKAVAAGKAQVVVSGFASTYTKDCKQFDDYYVEVPKGNVVFAAREGLDSGSEILVTGTVFLSNFEVKTDLDYGGQEFYANRNILLNYLSNNRKELKVSTIAEMRKGNLGDIFTVEGYVTAGTAVEGNKFFDTIYVQDETAGTTVFPVADLGIEVGTKLRLTGFVDEYQGDKELQIYSYKVLDDKKVYEPKKVTTKEAADYEANGGSLLKVEGEVTRIVTNSSGVDYFFVKDDSDVEARVFIDGYILASDGRDTVAEDVVVGQRVSAVGLCYMNPDGACLRVRDRAEIIASVEKAPTVKGVTSLRYTGKKLTHDNIRVFYDLAQLDKKDYTVTYKNNQKAYTLSESDEGFDAKKAPSVTITLKGKKSVKTTIYFKILPADISAENEEIVKLATKKVQKLAPAVKFVNSEGKTVKLSSKTDYTVSYPDEDKEGAYKKSGEWKIVVTGKGNYTGKRTFVLKIYETEDFTVEVPMDVLYAKAGATPEVTVKAKGITLTKGVDYTVSYKNNKKLYDDKEFKKKGAPVATVKFLGAFKGKKASAKFTIVPKPVNDESIRWEVNHYVQESSKKGGFVPKIKGYDGKKLLKTSDYSVKYTLAGKVDPETLKVTPFAEEEKKVLNPKKDKAEAYDYILIEFAGKSKEYTPNEGYYGSSDWYCMVLPASNFMSKATIRIAKKELVAKGTAVELDEKDFTEAYIAIKNGKQTEKTELKYGTDFEIKKDSYVANDKAGTAKVTLVGKGKFVGEKTVSFKIVKSKSGK